VATVGGIYAQLTLNSLPEASMLMSYLSRTVTTAGQPGTWSLSADQQLWNNKPSKEHCAAFAWWQYYLPRSRSFQGSL